MTLSNFQNHFSFSPFSDSCLPKIRVKTWSEESYFEEFHAIPRKFRNKLLLFHNRTCSKLTIEILEQGVKYVQS